MDKVKKHYGIAFTSSILISLLLILIMTFGIAQAEEDEFEGPNELNAPMESSMSASLENSIGNVTSGVNSYNGSFSSKVPIEVPLYHGLEPKLAFSYNSSTRASFLGTGWNLSGLSFIERASPGGGAPKYDDATDIFFMDGMELVVSTALGGTHCTKIQNFARIRRDTGSNIWYVWLKNGNKLTYGHNFLTEKGTFRWMLTEVEDPRGNSVIYEYFCDGSPEDGSPVRDCYIKKISYNNTEIIFHRKTDKRPVPIIFATGTGLGSTDYLLKSIEIKTSYTLVRAYKLKYEQQNEEPYQSHLESIQQFGSDASIDENGTIDSGTSLPAVKMTYQQGQNEYAKTDWGIRTNTIANSLSEQAYHVFLGKQGAGMGDFNGDGRTDFAFRKNLSKQYYVMYSNGDSGFEEKLWGTRSQAYLSIGPLEQGYGDFNGDGKTDYMYRGYGSHKYHVMFSTGSGVAEEKEWGERTHNIATGPLEQGFGDFNGDGRTDYFYRKKGTKDYYVMYSTANSFKEEHWGTRENDIAVDLNIVSNKPKEAGFGDFNGDGRTDYYYRAKAGHYSVMLSTENGLAVDKNWGRALLNTYGSPFLGDFNGDGKTDFIYLEEKKWSEKSGTVIIDGETRIIYSDFYQIKDCVMLSTGTDFDEPRDCHNSGSFLYIKYKYDGKVTQQTAENVYFSDFGLGDFNGDGKVEISYNGNKNKFYADFNGDGKTDILFLEKNIKKYQLGSKDNVITGLLSSISHMGGETEITYTTSADSLINSLPVGMKRTVVSSLTKSDGRGGSFTTNYKYTGGRFSATERRFLGFSKVTSTDSNNKVKETQNYQNIAYINKASTVYLKDTDNKLLQYFNYNYKPYTSLLHSYTEYLCNMEAPAPQFSFYIEAGIPYCIEKRFPDIVYYIDHDGNLFLVDADPQKYDFEREQEYTFYIENEDLFYTDRYGHSRPVYPRPFNDDHYVNEAPPAPEFSFYIEAGIPHCMQNGLEEIVYYIDHKGELYRVDADPQEYDFEEEQEYTFYIEAGKLFCTDSHGDVREVNPQRVSEFFHIKEGTPYYIRDFVIYYIDFTGRLYRLDGDISGYPVEEMQALTFYIDDRGELFYTGTDGRAENVRPGSIPDYDPDYNPDYDPNLDISSYLYTGYFVKHIKYNYDMYGNRTETYDFGDVDKPGDEKIIIRDFSYNDNDYIVGLPSSETMYKDLATTDDKRINQQFFYYDTNTSYNDFPTKGDLTKIEKWNNQTNTYVSNEFVYDQWGNITSKTDERNVETTYTFDSTYNLYPEKSTNALEHETTIAWMVLGKVEKTTDPNGVATQYSYDVFGRVAIVTQPDESAISYTYNDWGDAEKQYILETRQDGSENGLWVKTYYDGFLRPYKTIKKGDPIQETNFIQETIFHNITKKPYKTSLWYESGKEEKWITYGYDPLNRITKITHPDGAFIKTSYTLDENKKPCVTTIDEVGSRKKTLYDANGNISQIIEEHDQVEYDTTYTYDLQNNLIEQKDAKKNTSSFVWDSLGRKIAVDDMDMGQWTYTYDNAGLLLTQKSANDQTISFEYDALRRLVTKTWPTNEQAEYFYDESTYGIGRLTREVFPNGTGTRTHTWDIMGREESSTGSIDEESLTFSMTFSTTYDSLGRISTLTYPDGEVVTNTYDTTGRLNKVTSDTTGNITDEMAWNPAGQLLSMNFGNNTVTSFEYNSSRQYLESANIIRNDTTGQNLYNAEYTYNQNARINTITSTTNPLLNMNFTYDDLNRLTTVTGNQTQSFEYDILGNMTSNSNTGDYTYGDSAHKHAVTTAGENNYTYDDNGNMTSGNGRTMVWDAENRLISVTKDNITTSFQYDPDGNRIKKTGPNGTTLFFGPLAEMVDGTLVKYYYAGSILVSKTEVDKTLTEADKTFWYHTDHLSSTRFMTDSAGQIINSYDYSVYGSIISSSELMENDVNFTGHKNDPETGLIYMKSRYYDAALCRFISADTMGVRLINPQTMNRYSYVVNDPVNFVDPDGHAMTAITDPQLDEPIYIDIDVAFDTSYNSLMNDGHVLNDLVNFVDSFGLNWSWKTFGLSTAKIVGGIGTALAGFNYSIGTGGIGVILGGGAITFFGITAAGDGFSDILIMVCFDDTSEFTDLGAFELYGKVLGGETGREVGKSIDTVADIYSLGTSSVRTIPKAVEFISNGVNVVDDFGAFDE